jgi:hypothetical protein
MRFQSDICSVGLPPSRRALVEACNWNYPSLEGSQNMGLKQKLCQNCWKGFLSCIRYPGVCVCVCVCVCSYGGEPPQLGECWLRSHRPDGSDVDFYI